jgi:hypothetical protein
MRVATVRPKIDVGACDAYASWQKGGGVQLEGRDGRRPGAGPVRRCHYSDSTDCAFRFKGA